MASKLAENQARYLAAEHRASDLEIEQILWFPDEQEVWIVGVTPGIPISVTGDLDPLYFRADPLHDLPLASGVALIRPNEVGKLRLPERWGAWTRAIKLVENRHELAQGVSSTGEK